MTAKTWKNCLIRAFLYRGQNRRFFIVFTDSDDLEDVSRELYRKIWTEYYTNAELLDKASKVTANTAFENVTTALALIDDMGSDGKLDPSEKLTVKREFVASWDEKDKSEGIIDKCYDDSDHLLIGSTTIEAYINAFVALGTYLNGGTDWTAGLSMKNDTYRATDSHLPSWIQSGNMSTTNNITGSIWRTKWSDFYAARTAVLTALSAYAQSTAESAHERLDDMASDLHITPDEKKELRRQWQSWVSEYGILLSAASSATISADGAWGAYLTALYRLGHYLKDLSDSSAEIEDLAEFEVTMLITSGTTDLTQAQATLYTTVLNGFRTARTALLTALSTGKLNYWVSAFLPTSGFYVGDRCVWKDHLADGTYESGTDTTMICVKQYDESYVYSQASETASASTGGTWQEYWKEASTVIGETEHDPRHQLAALADRLYTLYGGDSGHFPIGIQLTDNGNSVTLSSGSYTSDDAVDSCLEQIRGIIGNASFSVCLSAGVPPVRYDMLCVPVSCSIPGSGGESVTGGIQIRMWNGTAWEYIQESTSSLLESLGNKILAMVFGSNAAATEAAGLTVGQRFAKLFAQAQVWDATANGGQGGYVTLTQALFGLSISQDINGRYYSSGLLSADKINFAASNNFTTAVGNAAQGLKMVMATEGQDSTFTLGYYYSNDGTPTLRNVLSFDSSGKLELTGSNVSIGGGFTSLLGITASSLNIAADDIDFSTGIFTINAGHITITDNDEEVVMIEDGKIRASLIDVDNLNVLGALTGQTIDMDEAEFQNLHVTGTSTFDGEVRGTITTAADLYRNVCLVTDAGNHAVGNADIVMIGGRFNGASEDVVITLPDPTGCTGKVITIYGAHRPADFDTSGKAIKLAISGGGTEIKTAWGTTGIPINHSSNSLRYTNEMVLRSDGAEWRLYKWTAVEVTNNGTYVKDALSGLW